MKEQIISFETAKSAKEKGFDNKTPHKLRRNYYNYLGVLNGDVTEYIKALVDKKDVTPYTTTDAPTQSLLQKWLREVHNIDITISLVANDYGFYIHKDRNYTNKGENYGISGVTYEEALEVGLFEGLKLIEI